MRPPALALIGEGRAGVPGAMVFTDVTGCPGSLGGGGSSARGVGGCYGEGIQAVCKELLPCCVTLGLLLTFSEPPVSGRVIDSLFLPPSP